jgi:hypothetical protein
MTIYSAGGAAIQGGGSTVARLGRIAFIGAGGRAFIWAEHNSVMETNGAISVSGSVTSAFEASYNASFYLNSAVTLVGNLSTTQFALANAGGEFNVTPSASINPNAFTVTGKRFTLMNSSVIWGVGGNLSYFPGSAPGTIDLGSSYDGLSLVTAESEISVAGVAGPPAPSPLGAPVLRLRGGDAAKAGLTVESAGGTPTIVGLASGGTSSSPLAVQSGAILSIFGGYGYGSSRYGNDANGAIVITSCQTFTDSAQCAQLDFYVTALGTIAPMKRWSMANDGGLISTGQTSQGAGTINVSGS